MEKGKEIRDQKEVSNELFDFYDNLFKTDKRRPKPDINSVAWNQFLSFSQISRLTEEQSAKLETSISEDELICALKNIPKINRLVAMVWQKEFYETFWDVLKIPFIASLRKSILKEELNNSQKQAVIRLTEEKANDKRFIQNWRQLTQPNTDVKIVSKEMTQRLKNTLPFSYFFKVICLCWRTFISEISDTLKLNGLLATTNIQKALDSLSIIYF